MFRPVLVCAYLGDQAGSSYYRVITPLLTARQKGLIQVRMPDKMAFLTLEDLAQVKPDTLLFHRSHLEHQKRYINEVNHRSDALLVYTIDDWVGKVPKESPHFAGLPKGIDKDIKKAIDYCDRLIVTTETLAQVYGYKKETVIIPNYLPEAIWAPLYKMERPALNLDAKPRIGWSGGVGHPGDLSILREVADILGDRVQWVFFGDMPAGFDQGNCEYHTPVPTPQYPMALYGLRLDLALAPLLDNDFNRAKSNLRVLEYGACGYATIASDIKTYRDTTASLCANKAEWWANMILEKIKDREALRLEGEALKTWVWSTHKLEDHIKEYGDVLSPDGESFVPSTSEISDTVDILITTHNNKEIVQQCVESVLTSLPHNKTKAIVTISDNASTEQDLIDYLISLEGKVELQFLPKDEGYIKNINSAIQLHPDRDVITLNSDTVVTNNWIDRLKESVYINEHIASSSPLSNNATILSYPNPAGSDLAPTLVKFYDDIISENPVKYAVIPTSIGFCTYIKRAALNDLGLFDDHAFGRGYGEENDWSMRSMERGWANIALLNTYVGHKGSATLSAEKNILLKNADAVLQKRWPNYGGLIAEWSKARPLDALRQTMDMAVIKKTTTKPRTLYIAHGLGGGLETYLQSKIKDTNAAVARVGSPSAGFIKFELEGDTYYNLPNIHIRSSDVNIVAKFIESLGVNHISIQTTFTEDYLLPNWIINVAKISNIPYSIMLHDYFMVCPRLRMVQAHEYCGAPGPEEFDTCNKCMMTYGSLVGQVDINEWRTMYGKLLTGAKLVEAPSVDVIKRYNKYFPNLDIIYKPHELNIPINEWNIKSEYKEGDIIRVAVLGYLTKEKGSTVVEDCTKYCLENNIPLKFMVFGTLVDNSNYPPRNIEQNDCLFISGNYAEQDLKTYLSLNKCHLSFFSALWPETYSYTLDSAFRAGLYPVAFDLGAIAERIKEYEFGEVLPLEYAKDIKKLVDSILKIAQERVK